MPERGVYAFAAKVRCALRIRPTYEATSLFQMFKDDIALRGHAQDVPLLFSEDRIFLRQGFEHVYTAPGGRLIHKLCLQDCMCRAVSPSPTDLPACLLQQALGNLDACQTESRRALERREASRNMRESMLFPSLRRLLRDCGWFGRALFGTEQASGWPPVMSGSSTGSGNSS